MLSHLPFYNCPNELVSNLLIEFPGRHYINRLKANSTGDFSILHLNINSVYLKRFELIEILNLQLFDVILLNETKLDKSIPESSIKSSNYKIIRYDRDRSGGGVLVCIRNWYQFTSKLHCDKHH